MPGIYEPSRGTGPRATVKNVSLYDNARGGQAPALRATDDSHRGGQAPALRAMDDSRRGGQAPALRATDDFLHLIKTLARSVPILIVPFWQLMGRFGRRKRLRHDKLLIRREVL